MIVEQHYSTTNSLTVFEPRYAPLTGAPTTSVTTSTLQKNATSPLETELVKEYPSQGSTGGSDWSRSSAAPFSVSVSTSGWDARATAETWLSFRVLQDTSALLTFEGAYNIYALAQVGLFDQTTGSNLFSLSYGNALYGYREPDYLWGGNLSSVSFSGMFDSDHIYELRLRGNALDNFDGGSRIALGVNGLHAIAAPVPEPATWAMMLVGFALVGGIAARRAAAR